MIKVRIWQDGYYPGGYQLQAVSDKITARIMTEMTKNGYPDYLETSAVASEDELELTPRDKHSLDNWGEIVILMDAWEFAHFYGYDAHTVFETKTGG